MAIALVSAGTVATASAATSVAPAFGQATTAGHLLTCQLAATANGVSAVFATTASGWTVIQDNTIAGFAAIAFKPNCGAGETAPIFTWGVATTLYAVLAEWSGAATVSPLDKHAAGSSPTVCANPTADTNNDDLALTSWEALGTKSTTLTISHAWAPVGGTQGNVGNTGATKGSNWIDAPYYLLNGAGGGAADTDTNNDVPSTGNISAWNWQIASFKAVPPPPTLLPSQHHRRPAFRGRPPARARFMVAFPKVWTPRLWLPAGAEV